MTSAEPRLLSARCLALAAVASALAVAALALSSGDALVDRGFETAFAAASPGALQRSSADDTVATRPGQDLWLAGHSGAAATSAGSHSRIGERISMSVDGGAPVELEVIAVTEIASPMPAVAAGPTSARLVMVTCRETGREAGGRVVRLILDGDEPLPGTATSGPARAL